LSEYPEHDKLSAVSEQRDTVQEFLDFLTMTEGLELARWERGRIDDRLVPVIQTDIEKARLIGRFFGIDADVLSSEKDAMLAEIRASMSGAS
jgi:hypothetical protein